MLEHFEATRAQSREIYLSVLAVENQRILQLRSQLVGQSAVFDSQVTCHNQLIDIVLN